MPEPVTWKKVDASSGKKTAHNGIRGGSKRGVEGLRYKLLKALNLVKTAASDEADCGLCLQVGHAPLGSIAVVLATAITAAVIGYGRLDLHTLVTSNVATCGSHASSG